MTGFTEKPAPVAGPAAFQPGRSFALRLETIGDDRFPVLVIDDFMASPDRLVDAAVEAFDVAPRSRDAFPGVVASAPEAYARAALDFLLPVLRKAFQVTGPIQKGGCDFQVLTHRSEQANLCQRMPHYDVANPNVLASVHFLCRPPFKGTAFFRHRATGYEIITPERARNYLPLLEAEMKAAPPLGYTTADTPHFSKIAEVPAVFNRLVFFPAACLHAWLADEAHGYDPDPRLGRLTANMFLQFAC